MNENINTTFTGTVNQLLEHCSKLEFDISEEQIKQREYEMSLEYIMTSEEVSREEAIEIYNMIALEEVKQTVDKLVKDGILECSGFDEDGEPKFKLTEFGKQCTNAIKIKNSKKNI
jgi:hypothetical protein